MTLEQIKTILDSTGFPVAYRCFKTPQTAPFICYLSSYRHNFAADGIVYSGAEHIQVELYTKEKNPTAEGKVEEALSPFFWEKTEVYINDTEMYQIIYEFEV